MRQSRYQWFIALFPLQAQRDVWERNPGAIGNDFTLAKWYRWGSNDAQQSGTPQFLMI
jgi:hypothetical protein